MKARIPKLIYKIAFSLSSRWVDRLAKALREFRIEFKSGWLAKKLKECGTALRIESPFKIMGHKYISIGNNFTSGTGLRIEAVDGYFNDRFNPEIIIGNNVAMNMDCHIACINKIVIGDNVLMASRVFITDHFHGNIDRSDLDKAPALRSLASKGPVIIEENVWIGEGVVILPGVTIGKGSIIGANAVVTSSFSENTTIAGVPARHIEIIQR